MVELKDVSKCYGTGHKVLNQVQLSLKPGEFLYVVGGSGTGKSSLLRLIAGEESPTAGSVSLFGYDLKRASGATLQAIRRTIGFIPQDLKLISDLTVLENIALSLSLAGHRVLQSSVRGRLDELLEKLNLAHKRDHRIQMLSGGEQQRVAVARALIRSPQLLIADEPTGSQDRDHTWNLMELILHANSQGSMVVLATHDHEIVRRIRKRAAVLKGGSMTLEDSLCLV